MATGGMEVFQPPRTERTSSGCVNSRAMVIGLREARGSETLPSAWGLLGQMVLTQYEFSCVKLVSGRPE